MDKMSENVHIRNRLKIIDELRKELVGPDPNGTELNISNQVKFDNYYDSYGPFVKKDSTGVTQEILTSSPLLRYGVGVLYPLGEVKKETPSPLDQEEDIDLQQYDEPAILLADNDEEELENNLGSDESSKNRVKAARDIEEKISSARLDPSEVNDIGLNPANAQKPSSMAVSFFTEINDDFELIVNADAGRYKSFSVKITSNEHKWWYRENIRLSAVVQGSELLRNSTFNRIHTENHVENNDNIDLRIEVYSRPYPTANNQLITICLINRTNSSKYDDESIVFQSGFTVALKSPNNTSKIIPYPGPEYSTLDEEEQSLELLYRNAKTYAVGHGCAADWEVNDRGEVEKIIADCLPLLEVPSVTPDVVDKDGSALDISMAALAGLVTENEGFSELEKLHNAYCDWIDEKKKEIQFLDPYFRPAAQRNLEVCDSCSERIREGIDFLKQDPQVLRAFRLANYAILLQQLRSFRNPRKADYDEKQRKIIFEELESNLDPLNPPVGKGKWRAFQIAFILMTIKSVAEGGIPDRDSVELIWFPTGGGKTEAYLGLSAFSVMLRRLRDPNDIGTDIIMRYTMRLLTAQQFQRAGSLVCALEYIRRKKPSDLGTKSISIGLWVGQASTPNRRDEAVKALRDLRRSKKEPLNKFVISMCPWCGAEMGPVKNARNFPRNAPKVLGYVEQGDTVIYRCPDSECEFSDSIPIFVIDEDIYDERPTIIIGTVDKFALLAWRPEIRSLFGIDSRGQRELSPPNMIIQDELHLISGPLGSMVGLYEGVVEELSTDRRVDPPVKPKIISSTATIRRYEEQIKALYAREKAYLFPPPGIEVSDSFFSKHALKDNGEYAPGRIYLGVNAPAFGSMQTAEVRAVSALLQAPMLLPENQRDPWWTLLLFFNSLRELGPALSLLQSDIPDYQKTLMRRKDKSKRNYRNFWQIQELTGRLSGERIPEIISELEITISDNTNKPIDVCLASNILEVGIDIDRLSLMTIIGQPISTSRYIQVTGRVGRSWWERPGLIVTIYSPTKSRDRSHFEKFKSYHQRLYAQVEPSSVTPFSPPALERSLHSLMVAYVRQFGDISETMKPNPIPEQLLESFREMVTDRMDVVNPAELNNFQRVFNRRMSEWRSWQNTKWIQDNKDNDPPLLYFAGQYVPPEHEMVSWRIQLSLRNVDAECREEIILPYFLFDRGQNG